MNRERTCVAFIVLLALAIQPIALAAVEDGLIGYWPFNTGAGKVAADVVGGFHGKIEGATWTDDAKSGGQALTFDPAADNKVKVAHADELASFPDGMTVTNWMKPDSRGAMMDKSDLANRMQWFLLEDGRLHWGAGGATYFTDGPVTDFGNWNHVAWAHGVEMVTVYVNGEVVHEQESGGPIIPTTEPLYFGDMGILPGNNPKQQNFEGGLDDFGLWNRALSAAEVKEVFEQGLGGILAVSPRGKLATQWAAVKAAR
jgi:hypothetical protein